MNLKNLKKDELLKLKKEINLQLEYIDRLKTKIKLSKEKKTLSDLKKNDKIFCIIFNGSKIYHMDYVKIFFQKRDDDNLTNFSTEHDTKTMGCSYSVRNECLNNHYFLSEFSSSMYFFTLKPYCWKVDLKSELKRLVKVKKKYFDEDLKKFKNKIEDLINNDEVETFIHNCL